MKKLSRRTLTILLLACIAIISSLALSGCSASSPESTNAPSAQQLLGQLETLGVAVRGVQLNQYGEVEFTSLTPHAQPEFIAIDSIPFGITCEETLAVLVDARDMIAQQGAPIMRLSTRIMDELIANGLWDGFTAQRFRFIW